MLVPATSVAGYVPINGDQEVRRLVVLVLIDLLEGTCNLGLIVKHRGDEACTQTSTFNQ
jgi:hypothetical protein